MTYSSYLNTPTYIQGSNLLDKLRTYEETNCPTCSNDHPTSYLKSSSYLNNANLLQTLDNATSKIPPGIPYCPVENHPYKFHEEPKECHRHKCHKNRCHKAHCHARHSKREEPTNLSVPEQNHQLVKSGLYYVEREHIATVYDMNHNYIESVMKTPIRCSTPINVTIYSPTKAAILAHQKNEIDQICILNFADSITPGDGYRKGQFSREAKLCRESLLYPTLDGNRMYYENRVHGKAAEASDIMIFSPDVYLLRDDFDNPLPKPFKLHLISSPPSDGFKVLKSLEIMETRIRKIIRLASYKKIDVLILGAFGCGAFRNEPKPIARIFRKVLVDEGLKDQFKSVVFSINDECSIRYAFQDVFPQNEFI